MLVKTKGIVFRAIKYSETSIIADLYTEKLGLRSYIISGVRTKNAKVSAGLLQVMSLVEVVVYHRNDKDLCRIKEIKASYLFEDIPFNVKKGTVGLFLMEIIQKSIKEREQNVELFAFLNELITYLDQTDQAIANLHLVAMLKLSSFLGFQPDDNFDENHRFFDLKEGKFLEEPHSLVYFLEKDLSAKLHLLLHTKIKDSHTLLLSRGERSALLEKIIEYYRLHIENMPEIQSHKILKAILE